MSRILWAAGWWLFIAGWFAIVYWPARVGLAMWQAGETPRVVELLPLGVIIAIGAGLVVLGKSLRRRSSASIKNAAQ
ncbi:MAG: hypothetical protein ABW200_12835 [Hyphomicrobiaceae bacterium]|jgi:hypothetical protein